MIMLGDLSDEVNQMKLASISKKNSYEQVSVFEREISQRITDLLRDRQAAA